MNVNYVVLKTEDRALQNLQNRIEKLSLIQLWLMKSMALLDRYLRQLNYLDTETDSVKRGILIEEIDVCFMSSVSYFFRCFLDQQGTSLKIKELTSDQDLRDVYAFLRALRDDEYTHWKGHRSHVSVTYSFKTISNSQCEFAKDIHIQVHFNDSIGPEQRFEEIKRLYDVSLKYVEARRDRDLVKMRERLALAETWQVTNLYNSAGEPIIKRA